MSLAVNKAEELYNKKVAKRVKKRLNTMKRKRQALKAQKDKERQERRQAGIIYG